MKKNREINPEAFEKMLLWLDKNREIAGSKYEAIRLRLIKIFNYRQCLHAEELTDKTIDRVVQKVAEIAETYEGDPALYFLSVADYIHRENLRKPIAVELPDDIIAQVEDEEGFRPHYECLKQCLKTLSNEKRKFIVGYYEEEKQAKIEFHKKIAQSLGIKLKKLHSRAFRIRTDLQKCVLKCVAKNGW